MHLPKNWSSIQYMKRRDLGAATARPSKSSLKQKKTRRLFCRVMSFKKSYRLPSVRRRRPASEPVAAVAAVAAAQD
jgi:hypothetical protein